MEYPFKQVAVDGNPGGTVVGTAVNYAPGGTLVAPPGGTVYDLPVDSPVTQGWRYVLNEDTHQYVWRSPTEPDNTTDAGNGNPPPPTA